MIRNRMMAVLCIVLLLLTACGSNNSKGSENDSAAKEESDKVYELKVGMAVGDWSALYAGFPVFIDLVEKNSNGRIKITPYPNAQLGGEREMMESIQSGSLEMGMISSTVYGNFEPKLSVFDLPFLVDSFEEAAELMDGPVGDKAKELLVSKGMRVLAWGHGDLRWINQNVRPVKTPKDMEGIKMRVPESQISTQWYTELGAAVVPLPNPEIYTALQQGLVNGQDNGGELTLAQKFVEHTKYSTITNHVYYPIGVMINEKVWSDLPEDLQEVLTNAALEAMEIERKAIIESIPKNKEKIKAAGIEIIELTEDEKQQWIEASKPIYEKAESLLGEELYKLVEKRLSGR